MVNTTGLVIVVSGLYVRDVEPRNPNDCDGDGVIEEPSEGDEGGTELVELLCWEVVEGGVVEGVTEGVWDEGLEVEEGVGGVDSSVLVLGGWNWLGGKEGGSLSTQISRRILSLDLWYTLWCFRRGTRGYVHVAARKA